MQRKTCHCGVFLRSAFYNALTGGVLNVPQPSVLPGKHTRSLRASSGRCYLIKTYAGEVPKGSPKRVFNYRLSRVCRIVENAFGLLTSIQNSSQATHGQTVYS
jgi:hypothetical protein